MSPEQIRSGWVRLPDAIEPNASVNDATFGPSGFVAVGYSLIPNNSVDVPTSAAIWTSVDGSTWTPVPSDTLPRGATRIDAVAASNGEFWAIGTAPDGSVIWRSRDGRTWEQEANPSPALPRSGLVADPLGLIAYGDGTAVARNGEAWQTSDIPGFVTALTRHDSVLVALAQLPVAQERAVVVFTSDDAVHWTRGSDLGPTVEPGTSTLTTSNDDLWAATYPGKPENASAVWRSSDGVSWVQPDGASVPPNTTFDVLTPMGPYLVATGFDTRSRPGGWVTVDGATWIPMPDLGRPPGGRLNIAASDGRTLLALSTSELRDSYLWHAPQS